MAKKRILFISQEITPYLPETPIASYGRNLAQGMHNKSREVRIFMPNYGSVNERRNQLHEVIRLSGLNIIIAEHDHPLIIKVASLQPSRIQVYFADNDDYFQKENTDVDSIGSNRDDNDERVIFFARGAAETVKKLRWGPEVIHCDGWITALTPLYLRKTMVAEPQFDTCRIIYDVLPGEITGYLDPAIFDKMADDGVTNDYLNSLRSDKIDTNTLHLIGISEADAVVFHTETPDPILMEEVKKRNLPYIILPEPGSEAPVAALTDFYSTL